MRILRMGIFIFSALLCAFVVALLSLYPGRGQRIRFCANLLHHYSKILLKIFRIEVQENALRDDLTRPHVLVSNHVSYLDIPILLSRQPALFVAKSEIAEWPLIGFIANRAGMIFVNRKSLKSRARALHEIQNRLRLGLSVVVFPEGTTSVLGPRRQHSNFFGGAFAAARGAECPLELLYLDFQETERCAWLADQDFVSHLWSYLKGGATQVRLRSTSLESIANRHKQRQIYDESRAWLLEGGLGILNRISAA